MALSTLAKPPKKVFDVSKSLISNNSSKLAPAQNAFSPSDFSKMAFTSSLAASSKMVCANFSKNCVIYESISAIVGETEW